MILFNHDAINDPADFINTLGREQLPSQDLLEEDHLHDYHRSAINSNAIITNKTIDIRPGATLFDTQYQDGAYMFDEDGKTNCSRDRAYLAIIITVIPLWAILTALIVFVLLSFHRNLRATKVYDNCSKSTAHYTYLIELRTGDTSSSYNRRRTTLTIDMFDDNQTTLARIAVPGHVIFGRKDTPIANIDDDKYSELRVTRFWLYRAIRLQRVATIRLTHTCAEPEAKIMVYGIEIKSSESGRHRSFFPVMSYISAYGSTNKPNACFDLEPAGSISNMGGSQIDAASIDDNLTWVDYMVLVYLLGALIFFTTTYDFIDKTFEDLVQGAYKGLIAGSLAFSITFVVGLVTRYVTKYQYALRIGLGFWAIAYYSTGIIILIIGSGLWIYTTITAYKNICPDTYHLWVLSTVVALGLCVALGIVCALIYWIIQTLNPKYVTEQYVMPEDSINQNQVSQDPQSTARLGSSGNPYRYSKQQLPVQHHQMMSPGHTMQMHPQPWHMPGSVPQMQMIMPGQGYQTSPNMYGQSLMVAPMMNPVNYKTASTGYPLNYDQQASHPPPMSYQQQPNSNQVNLQGIKGTKKIGSSESTGSTYYQQLMKNKGGVKSISQYGELLKQKKAGKK